jgi:hypothetical protein
MTIKLDLYSRVLLTVIAVLMSMLVISLWVETPPATRTAQARLPDSGAQFNDMITGLAQVQAAVKETNNLLRSATLKVQVIEPTTAATKQAPAPRIAADKGK